MQEKGKEKKVEEFKERKGNEKSKWKIEDD